MFTGNSAEHLVSVAPLQPPNVAGQVFVGPFACPATGLVAGLSAAGFSPTFRRCCSPATGPSLRAVRPDPFTRAYAASVLPARGRPLDVARVGN